MGFDLLQDIQRHGERWYLYLGHFWHHGWSIVDVTDPAAPELVRFVEGPAGLRTAQIQVAGGIMATGVERWSENREGYEAGNAVNAARDLKGRLLIYYGTADNNVHPNNSLQLIRALQIAGKSFEVQVGPDQGHSGVNQQRMMEFFIESLR